MSAHGLLQRVRTAAQFSFGLAYSQRQSRELGDVRSLAVVDVVMSARARRQAAPQQFVAMGRG